VIARLEAHGYRCFPLLSVDLDRYHVLAGPNGAGKTTLLDIPVLIGDMPRRQRIVAAFLERTEKDRAPRATTLTDLLHKGRGESIAFAFEARLPPDVTEALGEASMARLGRPVPTHWFPEQP
jgi:ABC-type hemin transport system ATPase subunit